jgi:tetratricopeptide (TPR) repeat protein
MYARREWTTWQAGNRLRVLAGPAYTGAADAWTEIDAEGPMPPVIVHPVLAREAADDVVFARELVERIAFGAQANLNARKRFAARYLLNTLKNLPVIAREGNAGALFDGFTGVPAIVVSAGPSLDRNVAALQQFQDRALLIAVDTALRPLLRAGVVPHLVASVDPSELNARHLADLPDTGRASLVAEGSLNPIVFEPFTGRIFIFKVSNHHPWPWLRGLGIERDTLRAWGSVATSTFDLAIRMGCDPIVFAGQDLAFTDGRPYSRGTTFEGGWAAAVAAGKELPDVWANAIIRDDAQTVNDVHGHPVVTTSALVAFRDWIAQQAALLEGRTIVNATGGGILHGAGIRQADLSTVLASLPPLADLDARVRICWNRTSETAGVVGGRHLLTALARARDGDELTAWASFANMTPDALAEQLNEVTPVVQHGLEAKAQGDPHPAPTPSHARGNVLPPERMRIARAILLEEPVPEWAQWAMEPLAASKMPDVRDAIEVLPAETLYRAAMRYEAEAAYDHAVALFANAVRKARDEAPDWLPSAAMEWLRSLFWAGRFDEALVVAERESLLPDPFVVSTLSNIYQLTGKHDEAVAKIRQLIADYPDVPGPRAILAGRLAMGNDLEEALTLVDEEDRTFPVGVSRFARAVCLRLHGDYDSAIALLEAIVDDLPWAAPELTIAGAGAKRNGVTDHALRVVDRAYSHPVQFTLAPPHQAGVVDEALARIGTALSARAFEFEVTPLSPIARRVFARPATAWRPTWQP